MLGSAGTALEWVAAGLDRGGLGLRPDDDLGGQASPGQSDRHALRQRGEADAEGDERLGDRGPSSAFAGEVVRRDPRNPERSAGRLASFKSLSCRQIRSYRPSVEATAMILSDVFE